MLHQQYYDQAEENMIKGLDDDEIEFLDLVDRTKLAADRKKELEEEIELNDYRNRVASLQEKTLEERLQAEINVNKPKPASNRTSQQKLLKGVVLKKSEAKKRKNSDDLSNGNDEDAKLLKVESETSSSDKTESENDKAETQSETNSDKAVTTSGPGLKCVAILPGLGCYNDSTSDENSSDSEVEQSSSKTDILGRKVVNKGNKQEA